MIGSEFVTLHGVNGNDNISIRASEIECVSDYREVVKDKNGNPLAGVVAGSTVYFCRDKNANVRELHDEVMQLIHEAEM